MCLKLVDTKDLLISACGMEQRVIVVAENVAMFGSHVSLPYLSLVIASLSPILPSFRIMRR